MATYAPSLSLAAVPPMPVIKQTSPPSITSYLPLFNTFLKYNILIIGGDINVHIDKDENYEFCLHNVSNKTGEYLPEWFLLRTGLYA